MGVGAIALIVIFQQEIRRFLLFVGKSTAFANNRILGRFFRQTTPTEKINEIKPIIEAVRAMSTEFTGGLLVLKKNDELDKYLQTGEEVDSVLSKRLFLSLFNQYSPMNDGGVIVADGRIKAARCILPVSDSDDFGNLGFRHRAALGITPRKISDEEIVQRLVFSLVNEGARILEDGIASKASDIDMVYLMGYGFPIYRGGPMHYADRVGLFNVVQAMNRFAKNPMDDAKFWQPAPLLAKLAAEGKSFT